jgi:hypothetical protein
MYIGMLIFPEEVGEREKRQVVVSPLEAGQAAEHDHDDEELFDVFYHSSLTNITVR